MIYLESRYPQYDLWSLDWNTGKSLKLTQEPLRAPTRPFGSIGWLGQVNEALLFGDFRSTYRTDGTVEGTKRLGGSYLGELNGQHIVASSSTGALTTDGTSLFDLQDRPFKPAAPGLPAPPVYYTYSIDGNSIIQTYHYSFYGNVYSVWNGSTFAEFADSTGHALNPLSGSTNFTKIGDTWYGIDGSRDLPCHNFRHFRSDSATFLRMETLGRCITVQEITFFAEEGRLDDSPLFVSVGPELWAVDGDGPMELISDTKPVESTGVFYGKTAAFLLVNDEAETSVKLLATNGNTEATVEVPIDAKPISGVPWQRKTLVIAESAEHGQELWVIDGSYEQTPHEGLAAEMKNFVVNEGFPLSVNVDVTSQEVGDLSYEWDLNNDGEIDQTTSDPELSLDSATWQTIDFAAKELYIPFSVRVSSATESIVESGLLQIEDAPPIRTSEQPLSIRATGDRLLSGDELSITYDVQDGGPITFQFDLGDGTIIEQNSPTITHTYAGAGQYTIWVTATDQIDQRISDTLQVGIELEDPSHAWIFETSLVFGGNELTTDVDVLAPIGASSYEIFTPVTDGSNQRWKINRNRDRPQQIDSIRAFGSLGDSSARIIYSAVGDINNDGNVQQLVATLGGGLEGWTIGDSTTLSYDVALGDLDGDGDLDVFAANYQNADHSPAADWVFINDGDGSLYSGAGFRWTDQRLGSYQSRSVELGDVDGDGDMDAVTAALWPDTNHLWLNDGNGNFTESNQPLGPGSEHVALGDVDRDGDLDLFIAVGGANQVWLNDGTGQFSDSGQRLGTANSSHVALGDLDLDGDLDAFVANWEGNANTAWVNDGSGNFSDSGLRLAPATSTEHVALADLDGDGDLDVLTAGWGSPNHLYLNQTIIADIVPPTFSRAVVRNDSLVVQFSEPIKNLASVEIPSGAIADISDLVWTEHRDGFTWNGVDLSPGDLEIYIRTTVRITDLAGNALEGYGWHNDGTATFLGYSFPILVPFDGDLDGDLDVDFADFLVLSTNFGKSEATSAEGDIDGDGAVSFADFLLLSANFGKS